MSAPRAPLLEAPWRDRQARLGWAAVDGLLPAATGGVLAADRAGWPGYLSLGVFLLANAVLLSRPQPGRAARARYLSAAYVIVVVLVHVDPNAWLVLILLVPQTFAFLDRTAHAVAAFLGLVTAVAMASGTGPTGGTGARLSEVLTGVVALSAAVAVGLFVKGLLRETHRRGALIRDLDAARDELARAQHAAGVLAERDRFAHEIHDTLAQGFTSLLALVQAADATVDTDPPLTRQRLALAARTARDNLEEAQALVAGDRPVPLRGHTLTDAVHRLARNLQDELTVPVHVWVSGETEPANTAAQVVVLRVLQEALANVRKHAAARSIHVRLHYQPGCITLDVQDDGRGFDPAATGTDTGARTSRGTGVGLGGMRERVESTGGTFTLSSAPGSGSNVRAQVHY